MLVENSWAGLPCFVSGFDALVSNRAEMWRTNLQIIVIKYVISVIWGA